MNTLQRLALIFTLAFLASCGGAEAPSEKIFEPQEAFSTIVSYMESNGDFINSPHVPAMISAAELYNELDSNVYLIDTRSAEEFANAHIAHSVNIPFGQLLNHFEGKIAPSSFKKIVLVCNSGQTASYAASILRILGYNNVYVLKWGISSWHRQTAERIWLTRLSNKYSELLVRDPSIMNQAGDYPLIDTDEVTGYAIVRERAKKLFAQGYRPVTINADTLFDPNHDFYIINYWPENLYNKGHIPRAVRYQPKKSLHTNEQLSTLPTDRPIVVYCFTGQHSSFVTAFLRLLGYDAYTLSFGANGFMHGVMIEEGMPNAFKEDEVLDLPVTSGGVIQESEMVEAMALPARGGC